MAALYTPDFSALDRGDVARWTPALKEELVRRLDARELGLNDALRTFCLTLEEVEDWRAKLRKRGRRGLQQPPRTTKAQRTPDLFG